MENFSGMLVKQLNEINDLIEKNNKNLLKLQNVPSRLVKTGKSNGCIQYYWFDRSVNKRIYINKAHKEELRKTLQRDYEISLNMKLNALKRKLTIFLSTYDIDEIERVYTNLPEARKILVTPIADTKEDCKEVGKC